MSDSKKLDLNLIRERLSGEKGQQYWRSLEEIAETKEFQEFLHREFPREASVWEESFDRRSFLKLMGASLALAGLSACTKQPEERIVPYVKSPEIAVPGKPLHYATAMPLGGYANGILVTSHLGRPTKIEGNPDHPASLGAADIFAQASLLSLYDPDRSQVIVHRGSISTWDKFISAAQLALEIQTSLKGAGLRFLTETVTSPTLTSQIQSLLTRFPEARWYQYEPINADAAREGLRLAFSEVVDTTYRFDQADVVLALDSDFLTNGPGAMRYARDFAGKRKVHGGKREMNRLYVVENMPTSTGAMADHRLVQRSAEVENIARAVGQQLGIKGVAPSELISNPGHIKWIAAVARDLQRHRGRSVVVVGPHQPAIVHALAHAINDALGNVGKTVVYTSPVEARPSNHWTALQELVQEMSAGKVDMLVMLGGNPVYNAPVNVQFADALAKVGLSIHLSMYEDETSARSEWHVPESHYLETWSDARTFDGTTTIMQPLIQPLYNSKSAHELLDELLGRSGRKGFDIVTEYWKTRVPAAEFERFWKTSLNDGVIANSSLPEQKVKLVIQEGGWLRSNRPRQEGLEINFRPDPSVWDGRFSNNGWLQELPKPITKLTWDNAAFLSPTTAQRLEVENEDTVELRYRGRTLEAPVWILPGHADESVTLHLGYGRTAAGKVGNGTGFNANALRTAEAPWFDSSLEIRKTTRRYKLAVTQHHHSMEGRDLVRAAPVVELARNPSLMKEMGHTPTPDQTLYPPVKYDGYAWGMSIDLTSCTGCNACVIGCQSENNIPIVGKDQVQMGREMHWIRVDRYFKGDLENPEIYNQPVTCMHCENAPCELVCPVAATVHDSEGLNVMVYNRCIGTRYCSNNCPYKVRRFNFLQYSDNDTPTIKMMQNPDVTVRSRGVMEKCSYCVQRINSARIEAEKEGRTIRDGEVVTACQAACPTQAISFGDTNNTESQVARLKAEPHDYGLLAELNTKPRTSYLAKLKNPNPELQGQA